ncbi:ABC transporter permease [Nocardia arthritidis]|uniref:ABC transporter permease subunit n=1 Tax=Nocardia arthritidis TaxID=228602 RepID=A0A6G9Y5N6_9NOCA|nr:ABC transporter permease subunit [Nocardia arthritidis]
MTAPEIVSEPAVLPSVPPVVRRRRIPGLRLFAMTVGVQRATLVLGVGLVALFVIVALLAPWIAPYGLSQSSSDGVNFVSQQAPSAAHWFGTSVRSEDVFSRVIWGARTALLVIVISLILSLFVGVPLGLISGYVGRWVDRILVTFMDAIYAFPTLLLAIVVSIVVAGGNSSSFGGVLSAAVAITAIYVPQYFRVVRNATVAVKQEPFVDAARVTGASTMRIMFRHVLANVTQSLPVIVTLNAGDAILTLAALGFLGFGIEPTQAAEWGYDLNKALSDVSNGIWWTGIFPGLAIVLVVLGMTLVGESLNEVLNPLLRTRRALGPATVADDTAALLVPVDVQGFDESSIAATESAELEAENASATEKSGTGEGAAR